MVRPGVSFICTILLAACQSDEAVYPEVVTSPAEAVSIYGAELIGEFRDVGAVRPVLYGFLLGESPGQNLSSGEWRYDLGQTSSEIRFSIQVFELEAEHTYHYRSFAANSDYSRISYGGEQSFTTLSPGDYVETLPATGIAGGNAVLNATITSLNGWTSSAYGFVFGTSNNPVLPMATEVVVGSATGALSYQYALSGLSAGIVYYFRPILYSPDGTRIIYGPTLFFTAS